jgi:hypothetical protein
MTRSDVHRVPDGKRTSSPRKSEHWEIAPEPPPCDGCAYAMSCRKRQLACRAFAVCITTGRWKGCSRHAFQVVAHICGCSVIDLMTRDQEKRGHSRPQSHSRPVRRCAGDGRLTHPSSEDTMPPKKSIAKKADHSTKRAPRRRSAAGALPAALPGRNRRQSHERNRGSRRLMPHSPAPPATGRCRSPCGRV